MHFYIDSICLINIVGLYYETMRADNAIILMHIPFQEYDEAYAYADVSHSHGSTLDVRNNDSAGGSISVPGGDQEDKVRTTTLFDLVAYFI